MNHCEISPGKVEHSNASDWSIFQVEPPLASIESNWERLQRRS